MQLLPLITTFIVLYVPGAIPRTFYISSFKILTKIFWGQYHPHLIGKEVQLSMQRASAKPPCLGDGRMEKPRSPTLWSLPFTPLWSAQNLTMQRSNGHVLWVLHLRVHFCSCDRDNVWAGFCMFSILDFTYFFLESSTDFLIVIGLDSSTCLSPDPPRLQPWGRPQTMLPPHWDTLSTQKQLLGRPMVLAEM